MNFSLAAKTRARAVTSLIGREELVTELRTMIADPAYRLLTLHGHGGVGKTQLALASITGHNKPAYFVALEAVEPAGPEKQACIRAVAYAIARTLNFRFEAPGSIQTLVRDKLAQTDCILVLDNFEHLLAARSYLTELHDNAPDVQIVVTSREHLQLPNEWVMEVEGLSTDKPARSDNALHSDAARLFISHACELTPGFDASKHHRDIESLCATLEGSPLTIKLAAGLVDERSPAAIAKCLSQGLDVLRDTRGALLPRHASARSVIESSWKLLPEKERMAFARLSMFIGTFSATAAAEVAHCEISTLALLVERNWVRLEQSRTGVRYGLHPLLQTYGQDKLTHSTAAADPLTAGMQQRHAHYFLALLLKHAPALQAIDDEAFYQIDLDLHNIRLAWSWLQSESEPTNVRDFVETMHFYFVFKGNREEAIEMLEAAISMGSVPGFERVRWGRLLTQCYFESKQFNHSRRAGFQTLAAIDAVPSSSRWQLSLALPPLAATHLKDELFGIRPVPAEPWASDQAFIMARLGTIGFLASEDPVGLLSNALRTGRFARQRHMPAGVMWSNGYLAILFRAFGMHRLADRYSTEAFGHLNNIDGDTLSSLACQSLCVSEIMAGNWSSARRLLDFHFDDADAATDWRLNQDKIALNGLISLARGELSEATPYWQALIDNGRNKSDKLVELWGLVGLLESKGQPSQALSSSELSRAHALVSVGSGQEAARLSAATAANSWQQQDHKTALKQANDALKILSSNRSLPFYSVKACRNTAEVLIGGLRNGYASPALSEQAVTAERLLTRASRANRFGLAGAAIVRGDLADCLDDPNKAWQHWRQAKRLAQRFDQATDLAQATQRLSRLQLKAGQATRV